MNEGEIKNPQGKEVKTLRVMVIAMSKGGLSSVIYKSNSRNRKR